MSSRPRATVSGFLTVVLAIGLAPVLAQTPEGVSPGAVDRIDAVESRCPTFIWGGVPESVAYELVVYRLPDEPQASGAAEIDLSASNQVLYSRVPGGATAWQPGLADGLDPGGSYVWFVRAVLREEAGEVVEAGDWSVGKLFSIPAIPSAMEVEAALKVLRRYTNSNEDVHRVSAPTHEELVTHPAAQLDRAPKTEREGTESLKNRQGFTAAILGEINDPSGLAFGVVGFSSSPDGGGMAAANLAGGPDLMLDGAVDGVSDTNVFQDRIEVSSGGPRTFSFSNTGGGGMTLDVDGVGVTTTESDLDADKLTTGTVPAGRLAGTYSQPLTLSNAANDFTGSGAGLTGVDADTLDGTDGAAFATDVEAAALVAVHAASADHDGRYYTETELSTSGTVGAVHWDNLGGLPSGFADGVDDDTTYSPGPGLIVDGGEIRIDWGHFHTRRSTLDSGGSVGRSTSIAIGADGLGLISYYDSSNGDLKVAHCINTACTATNLATIDSVGDVGQSPSIAIGTDGLGLISYADATNHDLKVAHCNDTACTSATTTTIDSAVVVGWYSSIAIGADGLGLISYHDVSNADLKVAHCADTACSSATHVTLDSVGWVGFDTSIAIGADGLGIISYSDLTNGDLKAAHCSHTACYSATTTTLDSGGGVGQYTSIAIGVDGLALISYFDGSNQDLKVAHLGLGVP